MEAQKDYIFISYSRKDSSKVIPIVEEMQNSGYNVWYDKKIPVGKNWLNSLASHIKRCTVCVAFHSSKSRDSKYCQREIHYALKKEKSVFSVYLEDVTLEDGIDFLLSPFQSVRYTNPAELLEVLGENPEFECCRTDAPKKRKRVNLKKIAKLLLIVVLLLVARFPLLGVYRNIPPIGNVDKGGVLDIKSLPFSKDKMENYNYELNDHSPPPWSGDKEFVQCVVIHKGVTHIGNSSFENCSNMKFAFIPEGVTSIGKKAFFGCKALNEINFPVSLDVLGEEAFSGCTGLKEFYIPRNGEIKQISSYVFSDCIGLKEIYIPYGVTNISDNAFSGCTGLESVTFASSVANIEPYAFSGCTSLKQIEFMKGFSVGIQEIGPYAFSGCLNLKSVRIQGDRESVYIDATAFDPDFDWNTIIYD